MQGLETSLSHNVTDYSSNVDDLKDLPRSCCCVGSRKHLCQCCQYQYGCGSCCRCYCCNICSFLLVRIVTWTLIVALVAYVGYAAYVTVNLFSMADMKFEITHLGAPDLCSKSIPLGLQFSLDNPASFGVELTKIDVDIYLAKTNGHVGFVSVEPKFIDLDKVMELGDDPFLGQTDDKDGWSSVLNPGSQAGRISTTFDVGNEKSVASLVQAIASETPTELSLKITASVGTTAYLIPISTTQTVTVNFIMNDPQVKKEKSDINREISPYKLLFMEDDLSGNILFGIDMGVQVVSGTVITAIKASIPDIFFDFFVGEGFSLNSPLQIGYGLIRATNITMMQQNFSAEATLPGSLLNNNAALSTLQSFIHHTHHNTAARSVGVAGTDTVSSTCALQTILNAAQANPITVIINPTAAEVDSESGTTDINDSSLVEFAIKMLSFDSFTRTDDNFLPLSVRFGLDNVLTFNESLEVNVSIHSGLYLSVYKDSKDLHAVVHASPFLIVPGDSDFNVSVELSFVEKLLQNFDTSRLVVSGTEGHNLLSSIFSGLNISLNAPDEGETESTPILNIRNVNSWMKLDFSSTSNYTHACLTSSLQLGPSVCDVLNFSVNIGEIFSKFVFLNASEAVIDVSTAGILSDIIEVSISEVAMKYWEDPNSCFSPLNVSICVADDTRPVGTVSPKLYAITSAISDYLHGIGDLYFRVEGSVAGNSSKLNPWFGLNIINDVFNGYGNELDTSVSVTQLPSVSSINFSILSSLINGTLAPDNDILLPCIAQGSFCPYAELANLSATGLLSRVDVVVENISLPLPTNLSFAVDPPFTIDMECCTVTPIGTITFHGISLVWRPYPLVPGLLDKFAGSLAFSIYLGVEPKNESLGILQTALADMLNNRFEVVWGARASTTKDILTSAFYIDPDFYYRYHFLPNNSVTAPEEGNKPNLDYSLTHTTASSAELALTAAVENPSGILLDVGSLVVSTSYADIEFANLSFEGKMVPGANSIPATLNLHGVDNVTASPCVNSSLINPAFCLFNEFVSKLLMKNMYPEGIPMSVLLSFYRNSDPFIPLLTEGKVTVRGDLLLFQEDPLIDEDEVTRHDKPPVESDLISNGGINFLDTVWSIVTSVDDWVFTLQVHVDLKNILQIPFTLKSFSCDVYQIDYDGVGDGIAGEVGAGPYAPNLTYLIASGVVNNYVGVTFLPGEYQTIQASVTIHGDSLTETTVRVFDDFYIQDRFCAKITNAKVELEFKAPSDPTMTFSQIFDVPKFPVSTGNCMWEPTCTPTYNLVIDESPLDNKNWFCNQREKGMIFDDTIHDCHDSPPYTQLELTPDLNGYVGYAWWPSKVSATNSWKATFTFSMNGGNPHSDGIAFVLQNMAGDINTGEACTTTDPCHGYHTIDKSIAVVFDAFGVNEVSIVINGEINEISETWNPPTFDDDANHDVIVEYIYPFKHLVVWIDGTYTVSARVDVPLHIQGSTAWVGFTASTPWTLGLDAEHLIKGFTFSVVKTDPQKTRIYGRNRILSYVNEVGQFNINARDSCDWPRIYIDDVAWNVTLSHESGLPQYVLNSILTPLHVNVSSDGETVTFIAPIEGRYYVYISDSISGNGNSGGYFRVAKPLI